MVSVIVPVFNSEKFLSRCIQSLVCQTLKNIEIILINDASTDSSLDIIKSFENKYPGKIKSINSEINLRQGGARNLGIKAAKWEYLAFVDSDDWIGPDMLLILYENAKRTDSDMVGCDYFLAVSNKNFHPLNNKYSKHLLKISGKDLRENEKERLLFMVSGLWCHLYRRSIIIKNDIFFIENMAYEDNHFVRLYTLYIKKYYFIQKPLYFYFKNPNSTTNKKNQSYHFDRILIERKKIEDYKSRDIFNRYKNGIELDFLLTFYINTVVMIFTIFDDPPLKKIKDLKSELCKIFPEYKKNPYYTTIPTKDRVKVFLAEKFPHILKIIYKIKQLINSKKFY
ncbi:MAG: glycosyltransferase [Oscillospiraceae bacterium]|nr:glycosyltransferase [Oscillospiraceae bacterium]